MKIGAQASIMAPAELMEEVELVRGKLQMNRSQFIAIAMAKAVDQYWANQDAFAESVHAYENNKRLPLRGGR